MTRKISAVAAFLGMLAILLGAFGAHALKDRLDPESLQSFETGVRYMMYHALALLIVNNSNLFTSGRKRYISFFFLIGILCFSGSIFVIALDVLPATSIWFVTPFGGLLFIIGWLITGISFLKSHGEGP